MNLEHLLQKTSRTFALAIPLLPEPTQTSVGLAYLMFRIADTFEDATLWSRQQRLDALHRFIALLQGDAETQSLEARQLAELARTSPPVDHAGYLELLKEMPGVVTAVSALPVGAQRIIIEHTRRTAEGMAGVVSRGDETGCLHLKSLEDLQHYCYLVAGIVGELLTELFLLDCPALMNEAVELRRDMLSFGEGLQIVNIVKDANDDARDGRVYLPTTLSRPDVLALARSDLDGGNRYVQALQRGGAPRGYVAFCGLSLVLAFKSLDVLEIRGSGAKVSRDDVARLFGQLSAQIDEGLVLDCRHTAQQ